MNNVDKVRLQNKLQTYLQAGGDYFCYVNGYYTKNLNLEIPMVVLLKSYMMNLY